MPPALSKRHEALRARARERKTHLYTRSPILSGSTTMLTGTTSGSKAGIQPLQLGISDLALCCFPAPCKEGHIQGYSNLPCRMVWMPSLRSGKVAWSPFAPHSPAPSALLVFLNKHSPASLLHTHRERNRSPTGTLQVPRENTRGPRRLTSAAATLRSLQQLQEQSTASPLQRAASTALP